MFDNALAFGQLPLVQFLVRFSSAGKFRSNPAISLTEPAISYLVEKYAFEKMESRSRLGFLCWLLGLGTVFSPIYGLI